MRLADSEADVQSDVGKKIKSKKLNCIKIKLSF